MRGRRVYTSVPEEPTLTWMLIHAVVVAGTVHSHPWNSCGSSWTTKAGTSVVAALCRPRWREHECTCLACTSRRYDTSDNTFKQITHTAILAAMAPVGGGRNPTSPRTLRHFTLVGIAEFDDATMRAIYTAIVKWQFYRLDFDNAVKELSPMIVSATMMLYKRACATLKPTPTKSHYTFNLRDFGRVIEGVVVATPAGVQDVQQLSRLWVHEASRVFIDRLNDKEDIQWCLNTMRDAVHRNFSVRFSDLMAGLATSAEGDVEADLYSDGDKDFKFMEYVGGSGRAGGGHSVNVVLTSAAFGAMLLQLLALGQLHRLQARTRPGVQGVPRLCDGCEGVRAVQNGPQQLLQGATRHRLLLILCRPCKPHRAIAGPASRQRPAGGRRRVWQAISRPVCLVHV